VVVNGGWHTDFPFSARILTFTGLYHLPRVARNLTDGFL
jgi:hypothetical protein